MKYIIVLFLCAIPATATFSQGCSDAGFCSLGALKQADHFTTSKQSIDIGINYGLGEQNTNSINPYLQYNLQLNNKLSILCKLSSAYANGFLGSTFGLGDVYTAVTFTPSLKSTNTLRLLGGIKLPLNRADKKNNAGIPLPLDYQSSIGTYDFIAGINYIINKRIELDAAIQVPFIQVNNNAFFPEKYMDARTLKFSPTNQFRRKSDLLLRTGYYINIGSTLVLKPNILAIYHTGEDTYQNSMGLTTSIKGSSGLTLNAGITASKQFKNNNRLEIILASPFVVREVRADGLTREFVCNLQYSIAF